MPSLWRSADFRYLWAGQTASQLGEHTSLVILPLIAVLSLGIGADQLGVLRAVGQAPLLLLTLFAGVWVDRWRTRTVMVLADLGRAVALLAAAAAAMLAGLTVPALLVVAFVIGTLSVFFDVAYQVSLIRLVRRDELLQGNSAIEGSRSAAQIAGPALAGSMASLLSVPVAAAATALLFVVSFGSIAGIRHREPPVRRRGLRRQLGESLRFVAGEPRLRAVCLAAAAFHLFLAATMTAYLVFLPRELGLSGAEIGLVLAAVGPGALAGALLAGRVPIRGTVLVTAALGDGVMVFVPALHGDSAATIVALVAINLVFGAVGQLVSVMVMTIRQAVTPLAMQGRVASTITFAGMGLAPVGSLAGGLLVASWGIRPALLVTAAGMLLSPLVMACSPLRTYAR
ncbi:MFS transporter [Actinoplanes sp. NBC_00393]|uniref:MFS transporter n=1 Tax=Actinoplanes sp. NBC_00393 TaxID=2975953 RepID=UPI002E236E15